MIYLRFNASTSYNAHEILHYKTALLLHGGAFASSSTCINLPVSLNFVLTLKKFFGGERFLKTVYLTWFLKKILGLKNDSFFFLQLGIYSNNTHFNIIKNKVASVS